MQSMCKSVLQGFTELQWESLMHQPPYVLLDLTREFYTGIPPKAKNMLEPTFSVVRGRIVSFSAEKINEVLHLPNVEDQLEDKVLQASQDGLDKLLRVLCVPGSEWVKDKPNIFKVRCTSLKPVLKALSLWVMNSLLPTTRNLFWHKERLFPLEGIMCSQKINVGKLVEREILSCARRTVGSLFFLNLIRLLCEAKEVHRFDQEEEDYPLDPKVNLDVEMDEGGVRNKEKEEVKHAANEATEKPRNKIREVLNPTKCCS